MGLTTVQRYCAACDERGSGLSSHQLPLGLTQLVWAVSPPEAAVVYFHHRHLLLLLFSQREN